MASAVPGSRIARFGEFEADLRAGQLRKRGVKLKLGGQSFEILAVLLERAGEVVTREDLRLRLWPGNVFVDFENNLNTAMARLRETLGDSADHPRFIETLPKRGYRFIASLAETRAVRPRLLVLPFINLSGDPFQEYFSDAMTEELIGALAAVAPDDLAVIARTTAMYYKGRQKPVVMIGREVSADYIVEGSARRTDHRVVANLQLIRTADETHLWTQRYDIELDDLADVENEAARAIATQLGITPRPPVPKPARDLAAYNLYIQGRHHLFRGTPEDLSKAKRFFEQATERDPNFALAYDALGEVYWYWAFFGFSPFREACSTGIYYPLRALEIDNTLAETHALLVMYRSGLDHCWAEVDRHMERALELDPRSPIVRTVHALLEMIYGRVEEAASELMPVLESDPLNSFARACLAFVQWLGRQYDRALEEAQALIALDPASYLGHWTAGLCYREKRMFPEAIAAHRKAVELSGGSPLMLGWLGLALGQAGERAEARAILERLQAIAGQHYVPPTSFAWIHLALGETDDAFTWMERAGDNADPWIAPSKTYPFLDPLRDDPRFLALLRKMNLAT
jgi:TolB-like protein